MRFLKIEGNKKSRQEMPALSKTNLMWKSHHICIYIISFLVVFSGSKFDLMVSFWMDASFL